MVRYAGGLGLEVFVIRVSRGELPTGGGLFAAYLFFQDTEEYEIVLDGGGVCCYS